MQTRSNSVSLASEVRSEGEPRKPFPKRNALIYVTAQIKATKNEFPKNEFLE
jgi:hypothetical protein